jgi:hypothetical protein
MKDLGSLLRAGFALAQERPRRPLIGHVQTKERRMKEALTDAKQRPGFPLRSLRSLQDGDENRGQPFALLLKRTQPLPMSSFLLGFGVCIRLLLSAFH